MGGDVRVEHCEVNVLSWVVFLCMCVCVHECVCMSVCACVMCVHVCVQA